MTESRNQPDNQRKTFVQQAFSLRNDDMGTKVVHGVSFTFLGIFLRTVLTIGSTAFLARLLTPADFGLIAMTAVVTELASLFGNFGFGSVLIQQQRITRLQLDTVFWSSLLLGIFLTICVFALSFVSSWFFQEERVGELLRVVCLTFLIASIGITHNAVLTRLMKFRTIFWIDLVTILLRTSTAVILAWQGYGVWSLVIGSLVGAVIKPAIELTLVRYWPRLRFNYDYLHATWKTNASYFGGGFLFYANSNLDLILIGRMLGASALGYYQNARSLTDEVRYRVAVPLQRVLFPAFSSLQKDQKRLQETVLKSGRMLAAIIFPLGIGIAAVADELVPVLYGGQWLAMIPILKFLGLSTAIKGSCTFATPLYNSQNKVSLALRYNIVSTLIVITSITIAIPWGLTAVAGAITLSALTAIVMYQLGLRLIGLGWKALWSMLAAPLIAALLMWANIELARLGLADYVISTGTLLWLFILSGGALYTVFLYFLAPHLLIDARSFIQKLRPAAVSTETK